MELVTTSTRLSAQEFLALPETTQPTELIYGEISMAPAPSLSHQDVSHHIVIYLQSLLKDGTLRYAPTDVHLDDENVLQPDIFWIAPSSTQCVRVEGKYLRGAPEFVIEILSESTELRDRRDKFALYERFGTREYWIVNTDAQYVEVWQRQPEGLARLGVFGDQDQFKSPLFQINIDVKHFFAF